MYRMYAVLFFLFPVFFGTILIANSELFFDKFMWAFLVSGILIFGSFPIVLFIDSFFKIKETGLISSVIRFLQRITGTFEQKTGVWVNTLVSLVIVGVLVAVVFFAFRSALFYILMATKNDPMSLYGVVTNGASEVNSALQSTRNLETKITRTEGKVDDLQELILDQRNTAFFSANQKEYVRSDDEFTYLLSYDEPGFMDPIQNKINFKYDILVCPKGTKDISVCNYVMASTDEESLGAEVSIADKIQGLSVKKIFEPKNSVYIFLLTINYTSSTEIGPQQFKNYLFVSEKTQKGATYLRLRGKEIESVSSSSLKVEALDNKIVISAKRSDVDYTDDWSFVVGEDGRVDWDFGL